MTVYSVITGDIISSSKLSNSQRMELLSQMKQLFDELINQNKDLKFEIFRGDSFQGVFEDISLCLPTVLMIKTGLKRSNILKKGIDVRIAIGIGEITLFSDKIQESDGEAFRHSGQLLDKMKYTNQTIAVKTPWKAVDDELEVLCIALDAITGRWSPQMAEVVYEVLAGMKQVQIADKLGIKQPSVNQRLKLANWTAVNKILQRFQKLLTTKI